MTKMKYGLKTVGCLVALGVALTARAQTTGQYMADRVVAVVGNSVVLYSDLDKATQQLVAYHKESGYTPERDPRSEALEYLITQKVLYNQAKIDSLKVNEGQIAERVQASLDQEMAERGSMTALEEYYHRPIASIRDEMTTRATEDLYAYQMESSVKEKVAVTPGEVEKFYKQLPKDSIMMVPQQYVYAQIVRYPSNKADADMRAQSALLDLRERIIKGEKFESLARIYGQDATASKGGDLGMITKESVVEPFGNAMVQLKPGQVSGVVETEYGFHLIQMVEQLGQQYHVRHILIKPRYMTRDMETPYKMLDSVRTLIEDGKCTFEEAVGEYSEDKWTKKNNGVVSNLDLLEAYNRGMVDPSEASTKFYTEQLSKEDVEHLGKLNLGDVSEPYVSQDLKSAMMCKMVKLLQVIPSHRANLSEDYKQIERQALAHKQERIYNEWLQRTIANMYVQVADEYANMEFENQALKKR